jgi:hypothetical protein
MDVSETYSPRQGEKLHQEQQTPGWSLGTKDFCSGVDIPK